MEKEEEYLCKQIEKHVLKCLECKKKYTIDPIQKALLNNYSLKNDVIELVTFIIFGTIIITILQLVVKAQNGN